VTPFLVSWAPVGLWAGFLFFLSSRPFLPGPPGIPYADKILHFTVYFILGTTLAWAGRRRTGRVAHWGLLLGGAVYALSDEWHQSFVPGRDPSGWDLLADVVGLLLGYGLARRFLTSSEPGPSSREPRP
jgi:VanZ family protein